MTCKQNLLEQIYIPKDQGNYKTFDNARPITKTSPIYKLIDTIINMKLNQELADKDGKYRLDRNQLGFRYGLGCEINILRLFETLKCMRKENEKGT